MEGSQQGRTFGSVPDWSLYILQPMACGVFSNRVLPAGSCGQPRGMARTCIVLRAYGASLGNPGEASHLVLFNKQWLPGVASSHARDLPSNSVFVAIYDSTNLKSSMFPYVLSAHPSTLFPYLPILPTPVWSFPPSVFFLSTFYHLCSPSSPPLWHRLSPLILSQLLVLHRSSQAKNANAKLSKLGST